MFRFSFTIAELKAAHRFCAKSDTRYYLNGVAIESGPYETRLIATDGHRMIVIKRFPSGTDSNNRGAFTGIIPFDAVTSILAWKGTKHVKEIPIEISGDDRDGEIKASWCGQGVTFHRVDGTFVDYRRVVPSMVCGEPAGYNPEYLVDCGKACADLGALTQPALGMNGKHGPAVVHHNALPNVVMIVMPKSDTLDIGISMSAWVREVVDPGNVAEIKAAA